MATNSCFKSVNDGPIPNSPMFPEVLNPINLSSIFSLNFKGWISPTPGTFTFMQWIDDRLETTTNVSLSKNPLDTSFWFQFTKVGCNDTNPVIFFGDKVQLQTMSGRIAQCGNLTCSTVPPGDYGGCQTGAWQTFIIRSAEGDKTGPVCFGQTIYLTQTTGSHCSISSAGLSNVFCIDGNTNNAEILIVPRFGSLYVDPTDYSNQYAENQQNELCKANPWDISCITSSISNFFSRIWMGFVIIAAVIALILIFMLIAYARSAFSGVTLFSSSSTVNTVPASTEKKA